MYLKNEETIYCILFKIVYKENIHTKLSNLNCNIQEGYIEVESSGSLNLGMVGVLNYIPAVSSIN